MQGVVVPLGPLDTEPKVLPHRSCEQLQGLDAGRDLVRLEPADRRLAAADPPRQPLLTEAVAESNFANQLTRSHSINYNEYVMNYRLTRQLRVSVLASRRPSAKRIEARAKGKLARSKPDGAAQAALM